MLDLVLRISPAHRLEAGATGQVLKDPARGKTSILDLLQDPAHFIARMLIDDTRTGDIVAEFSGIAYRVAHVAHPTLVHQIHDQLHLVHTLKVGHLRLIAGLYERLEPCTDQRCNTTTKDCLLAKEIGFGLLSNSCTQHTRTCAANGASICQGHRFSLACRVLVDCPQGGNAYTFGEKAAHHMARAFRRDHRDIDIGRGYNL